jgi:hypothetical protein
MSNNFKLGDEVIFKRCFSQDQINRKCKSIHASPLIKNKVYKIRSINPHSKDCRFINELYSYTLNWFELYKKPNTLIEIL